MPISPVVQLALNLNFAASEIGKALDGNLQGPIGPFVYQALDDGERTAREHFVDARIADRIAAAQKTLKEPEIHLDLSRLESLRQSIDRISEECITARRKT